MGDDGHRCGGVLAVLVVVLAACSGGSDDDDGSATPPPTTVAVDVCAPWTVEPIATGQGAVENLLVEDDGGLLLSVADAGEVRRLAPDGTVTTVLDAVPSPGGLARHGSWVYVTTGLTITSAMQGVPNATIVRFDPGSGERETWATGLVAPNGLAILDDGSAITTRTLSGAGEPAEVTRVPAEDPGSLEPLWSDLTGTNGAAVDATGEWLYVSRVAERAEIWRISTADPTDREMLVDLGPGTTEIPDDLTVTADDVVYATAWASGTLYRLDPATHDSCPIATGMPQITAVEPSPSAPTLFATSATGTIYELTPPM